MSETGIIVSAEPGYRWLSRSIAFADELENEYGSLFPPRKTWEVRKIAQLGEPIIAWRIDKREDGRDVVTPITIRGGVAFASDDAMQGILMPDGRVYVRGESPYDSVKAFFHEAVERACQRRTPT